MSYINNPDITKEDILKKSLAHWNVGKTQEWIDRDMVRKHQVSLLYIKLHITEFHF